MPIINIIVYSVYRGEHSVTYLELPGIMFLYRRFEKKSRNSKLPEEQMNEISNSLDELAKEVQDVKPGEEKQPAKKRTLNGKFGNVVRVVLGVLPAAVKIVSLFAPLSPFGTKNNQATIVDINPENTPFSYEMVL
jgi:hypothetical protein